MPPLTCLIGTFNEADRLPAFLQHAVQWADEIVIVDKGSTDTTRAIAADAGPKVKCFTVPFTPQGHENKVEQFNFCTHDWVFLMTPGEVPTRGLITAAKLALTEHGENVDIITIPKKLYSFGIHHPASPWSRGQQPFLLNRKRAFISNHVHQNFTLRPGGKVFHLPWTEHCHVYHPTHATVRSFLRSHFDYILAEVDGCESPEALRAEAARQIAAHDFGKHAPELFGQECAWKLYWLGCMLAAWEKQRRGNVPAQYERQTAEMLAREWPVPCNPAV